MKSHLRRRNLLKLPGKVFTMASPPHAVMSMKESGQMSNATHVSAILPCRRRPSRIIAAASAEVTRHSSIAAEPAASPVPAFSPFLRDGGAVGRHDFSPRL